MGDGYVGTAQDAVRIRRLEKQREAERRKIQELKTKSVSDKGQPGLLQFGSSTSEILETAFKKETVGLVTREEYVEKRVNIRNKIEEEEKEKLQKLLQEEEELQLEKRKKRKIKGNSRLSFADDFESENEEENGEIENLKTKRLAQAKLGKDPTVETSFLPDSEREAEEQSERERLQRQWLHEPLQITYSYWDGAGHRRVIQVRKGDTIGEFLRAVQQQLAPEFREIRTTLLNHFMLSLYSSQLFHFDVHEDVRTIADATIEKDESHAGKVVERHWYEKNKHIFPASRWEVQAFGIHQRSPSTLTATVTVNSGNAGSRNLFEKLNSRSGKVDSLSFTLAAGWLQFQTFVITASSSCLFQDDLNDIN
ncbi:protein XAP5 CIRCADIAN TIMEKEEPER [Citrus sinensis]|nr:protein XAP5 CIRCADIAN TIMEKEEPER [Citrus sinensis]